MPGPTPTFAQYLSAQRQAETTKLAAEQEAKFQQWAAKNNINDVDHPNSYYDYRGFWKDQGAPDIRGGVDHFPDTYKQHGHPTFSNESRYMNGPDDAGSWEGEVFKPTPAQAEDQYLRQLATTDPDAAESIWAQKTAKGRANQR